MTLCRLNEIRAEAGRDAGNRATRADQLVNSGCYLDNIFIERLWRSLKQEAMCLEEIGDGFKARRVVKDWMAFYNTRCPHSPLERQVPDDAYWAGLKKNEKQHET